MRRERRLPAMLHTSPGTLGSRVLEEKYKTAINVAVVKPKNQPHPWPKGSGTSCLIVFKELENQLEFGGDKSESRPPLDASLWVSCSIVTQPVGEES